MSEVLVVGAGVVVQQRSGIALIRVNTRATLIADMYTWSEAHPPASPAFFVPGGCTYAMQPYRDGFLVTDAHHNRVLHVRSSGEISVFQDFAANVVPTGLEHVGRDVLVGQAGPVPHTPETGRVVALVRAGGRAVPLASSAPLLVDVEVGRGSACTGSRSATGRTTVRRARRASRPRRTLVL